MNGLLNNDLFGLVPKGSLSLPTWLQTGYFSGGGFNLLAFLIGIAVTWLLVIGTSKSARVNAVLVAIKIVALTVFILIAIPAVKNANLHPFLPGGWGSPVGGMASACWARRHRSSLPTSASMRYPPPPKKPRIRIAISRSA